MILPALVGSEHFRAWKRIAVVSDTDWMRHAVTMFGWITPGDVKYFSLPERAQAISWVAG